MKIPTASGKTTCSKPPTSITRKKQCKHTHCFCCSFSIFFLARNMTKPLQDWPKWQWPKWQCGAEGSKVPVVQTVCSHCFSRSSLSQFMMICFSTYLNTQISTQSVHGLKEFVMPCRHQENHCLKWSTWTHKTSSPHIWSHMSWLPNKVYLYRNVWFMSLCTSIS